MKSIPYLIVLAIVACCGAGSVHAQNADRAVEKVRDKFAAADLDHDGFLTREEAAKGMPRIAKHFDEIDADHNGKVSLQEIAAFLKTKRQARES